MIFIAVKWPVRPEHSDDWLSVVGDFTAGTRSEPGNLFFDWSRSAEDPNEWMLVEGFRDSDAGAEHVSSDHFRAAIEKLPAYITDKPKIINVTLDQDDWSEMAELQPR